MRCGRAISEAPMQEGATPEPKAEPIKNDGGKCRQQTYAEEVHTVSSSAGGSKMSNTTTKEEAPENSIKLDNQGISSTDLLLTLFQPHDTSFVARSMLVCKAWSKLITSERFTHVPEHFILSSGVGVSKIEKKSWHPSGSLIRKDWELQASCGETLCYSIKNSTGISFRVGRPVCGVFEEVPTLEIDQEFRVHMVQRQESFNIFVTTYKGEKRELDEDEEDEEVFKLAGIHLYTKNQGWIGMQCPKDVKSALSPGFAAMELKLPGYFLFGATDHRDRAFYVVVTDNDNEILRFADNQRIRGLVLVNSIPAAVRTCVVPLHGGWEASFIEEICVASSGSKKDPLRISVPLDLAGLFVGVDEQQKSPEFSHLPTLRCFSTPSSFILVASTVESIKILLHTSDQGWQYYSKERDEPSEKDAVVLITPRFGMKP